MFEATSPIGTPTRSVWPDSWDEAHPIAAALYGTGPGAELAATLSALDPDELDAEALVEATAAWERMASWAAANQARTILALHRAREREHQDAFVGDEVAACLGTTRSAGDGKVGLALALDRLPAVAAALAVGSIDARKAALMVDELLWLGDERASQLADELLPDAPRLTVPQLRSRLRRLELAADPTAAQARHTKARAERRVELQPTRDAMAWLSAYLPADEATAAYTTLTALADTAAPEDPRGVDARRADALVDVLSRYLDAGVGLDGSDLPTRQRRRPHLNLTASLPTLLGLDEQPAELAGYGPIPAPMARAIAARATWTPVLVDHRTGELHRRGTVRYRPSTEVTNHVIDRDVTCTFPGCRMSSARCDVDHIAPFDPTRSAEDQTTPENLQALCRHHHLLKTHGTWSVGRDPTTGETTWIAPTGRRYRRPPVALMPSPGDAASLEARGPAPPGPPEQEPAPPGPTHAPSTPRRPLTTAADADADAEE